MQPRIFTSIIENTNYAYEGRRYPQAQTIPAVDFIYDIDRDGNAREMAIRYIPGEKSIYLEEQKTDRKIKPAPIIMDSTGVIAVDAKEINKLTYLLKCNYNENNPNKMPGKNSIFREYVEEVEVEKQLTELKEEKGLRDKIFMLDSEELETLATVLGDENASEKKNNFLLRDVLIEADKNPRLVRDAMRNTETQRRALVMKAFNRNFIFHDNKTNEIKWKDGGVIARMPMGKEPITYLTGLTFLDGYETLMDELNKILNPSKEREVIKEGKVTKEKNDDLFQKAIEGGIIVKNGAWWTLSGEEKGSPYKNFAKGRWDAKQFFDANKEMQEKVNRALTNQIPDVLEMEIKESA